MREIESYVVSMPRKPQKTKTPARVRGRLPLRVPPHDAATGSRKAQAFSVRLYLGPYPTTDFMPRQTEQTSTRLDRVLYSDTRSG